MAERNISGKGAPAPWWVWGGSLVVVLMVAGIGFAGWYRGTYHLWPWQDVPSRIHWCGRDYQRGPGPAVPEREVRTAFRAVPRTVAEVPPLPWHRHDLVAPATEDEARRRDPGAAGCATLVYLRLGSDRYALYELQGSL